MIEGGSSRDFAKVKAWAFSHPKSFGLLIDLLVESVVDHLAYQVDAGADAVQLFDSWAGILPEEQLFSWSLEPMVRIAHGLRARASQGAGRRLSASGRPGGPDVSPTRCLRRVVDRHRHRRALGRQGTAAAYLRAGQSRSHDAGGGRRRARARGNAHPRQARPRPVRASISATAWCRKPRRRTSRIWSRSCATGSLRKHRDRIPSSPLPPRGRGMGREGLQHDPSMPPLLASPLSGGEECEGR